MTTDRNSPGFESSRKHPYGTTAFAVVCLFWAVVWYDRLTGQGAFWFGQGPREVRVGPAEHPVWFWAIAIGPLVGAGGISVYAAWRLVRHVWRGRPCGDHPPVAGAGGAATSTAGGPNDTRS